jgi:pimeloyl-[acyl-carrier protein] methyl ester esterase
MKLHVERLGAGPDLVLLHGWALHGGAWAGVANRLAARFRVHVVDLPGHGHSRDVPLTDLDSLAATVADVVPAGSAACGWSLGGLVAMKLAAIASLGIRALGLVAATPSFVARADWAAGMAHDRLAGFSRELGRDRDATVRAFLHLNAHGASGARACVRRLDTLLTERPPASDAALAAGLGVLAATDLRAAVSRLVQPAVVIHGLGDGIVPAGAGQFLATTLPRARFVGLEDAAHALPITHGDAIANALETLDG